MLPKASLICPLVIPKGLSTWLNLERVIGSPLVSNIASSFSASLASALGLLEYLGSFLASAGAGAFVDTVLETLASGFLTLVFLRV